MRPDNRQAQFGPLTAQGCALLTKLLRALGLPLEITHGVVVSTAALLEQDSFVAVAVAQDQSTPLTYYRLYLVFIQGRLVRLAARPLDIKQALSWTL